MHSSMPFHVQEFKDDLWVLRPMTGRLKGCAVAVVDAVILNNVVFTNEALHGTIESIWGASIADSTYEDYATVFALRINRMFRQHSSYNGGTTRRIMRDASNWRECNSGRRVIQADRAIVFGANLHVSESRR